MVVLYELIRAFDLFLIGINPVSFARQVNFATVFGMCQYVVVWQALWPSVSWLATPASAPFFGSPYSFRV